MKTVNSIKRAVSTLDNIFNVINEVAFENKLSKAQVTAEKVKGAYGAFWVRKQYVDLRENWYWKIAINPAEFRRPIEDVVAVLVHEMCHQYAAENCIQDCSRSGTYHNKYYKAIAEKTGLISVEKHDTYGWTITNPTEKLIDLCIERGWTDFEIAEKDYCAMPSIGGAPITPGSTTTTPAKPKQSTRKHVCPCCGAIARTTKDIPLICGTCMVKMEQQ